MLAITTLHIETNLLFTTVSYLLRIFSRHVAKLDIRLQTKFITDTFRLTFDYWTIFNGIIHTSNDTINAPHTFFFIHFKRVQTSLFSTLQSSAHVSNNINMLIFVVNYDCMMYVPKKKAIIKNFNQRDWRGTWDYKYQLVMLGSNLK